MPTYTGRFNDGRTVYRESRRTLSHIWRVKGRGGRLDHVGYAGSYLLAVKAASAYHGDDITVEIIPALIYPTGFKPSKGLFRIEVTWQDGRTSILRGDSNQHRRFHTVEAAQEMLDTLMAQPDPYGRTYLIIEDTK